MAKCGLNQQLTSLLLFLVLACSNPFAAAQSVEFVIPGGDATPTAVDFSGLLHKPAGSKGFVKSRDGKFYVGQERIRFWGMNLCFGANFPTHQEADKVAPHMAKLGINSIRFHHMDMQDAPRGIWTTKENGIRELDPQQLDRLDYFLARLAENGIYANINLHVSRTLTEAEGFPPLTGGPWWASSNKWIMYYDPDVQAAVKKYCTDLLTHKNPYRGNRRLSDDPMIGLVEMMNENSFSSRGTELLRHLPEQQVESFRKVWNRWLVSTYKTDADLKTAWKSEAAPAKPLIAVADWTKDIGNWKLNLNEAKLTPKFDVAGPKKGTKGKSAIRFEPEVASPQRHFQQLILNQLSVQSKKPYSISFWVRSDKKRALTVEVATSEGGNWRSLGLYNEFEAAPNWERVDLTFFPEETIKDSAYLAFSFGSDKTPVELAEVSLVAGVNSKGIPENQNLKNESIGVPDSSFPLQAHEDLQRFMLETERAWVIEMRRFLIEDCGVKAPITASQENYHSPGVLPGAVDYVDLHNYWHHPMFPTGKNFNPTDYTVGNVPIESFPLQESWPARALIGRTGWRYHTMPFTLSEWNHPEPSDVTTGAIMMAAVVGRLQDWDGVYFFDYESDNSQWFNEHFEGFFDFNSQPAKLAVFSVASNIFLRGDLPALKESKSGTFEDRLDGRLSFRYKLGVDPDKDKPDEVDFAPELMKFETPTRSVTWDATKPEQGHLTINTPNTRGVWGNVGGRSFSVGDVGFDVKKVDRNYATMIATSLDNLPIEKSDRILVLASSGAENTNMKWNQERNSVSDQWGQGPTLVNVVTGTVKLPVKAQQVSVNALDGTGKPIRDVKVVNDPDNGRIEFEIGPQDKTIWYGVRVTTR